uniref:Agenet domain-containing protein n=1 Tax=Solanum tuberosum TaxID=4113 RepID=M1A321_SOLTU
MLNPLHENPGSATGPEYPPVHLKNKVSDVSSNSDVTVVVDGTWREGDLVDWLYDDCYWSGQVTKLLDNGKAKIELLPPPLGEGETYDAFVKDLRPSLDWSPEYGWVMPASQVLSLNFYDLNSGADLHGGKGVHPNPLRRKITPYI